MGARAFRLHFSIVALLLLLSIPFSQEFQSQMQLYAQKTTINVWLLKYDPGQVSTIDKEKSVEEEQNTGTGPNIAPPASILSFPNYSPLQGKQIKFFMYNPLSARPDKFDPIDSCNDVPRITDSEGRTSCDAKAELEQKDATGEYIITGCTNVKAVFEGDEDAPQTEAVALVCPTVSWSLGAFGLAMQNAISNSQNRIFCIPVFLILGLLLSSMYYSGKNPLSLFDITTPRLPHPKKGRIAKTVLRSNLLSKMVMDRQILSDLNRAANTALGSGLLAGAFSAIDKNRITRSNLPPALKGAALAALLSNDRALFQDIMNNAKQFYADLRSRDSDRRAAAEKWFGDMFKTLDPNVRNLPSNWSSELKALFRSIYTTSNNAFLQEQQIRDMEEAYGYDTRYSRYLLRPLHRGATALDRTIQRIDPFEGGYNKLFGLNLSTGKFIDGKPVGMVNLVGRALSPLRYLPAKMVQFARSPLTMVPIAMDTLAQMRQARKTGWNVMKGAGKAGMKMLGSSNYRNAIDSILLGRLEDPKALMDKMADTLSRGVKEDVLIFFLNKIERATNNLSAADKARIASEISKALENPQNLGLYGRSLKELRRIASENGVAITDNQYQEIRNFIANIHYADRDFQKNAKAGDLLASQAYLLEVHKLVREFEARTAGERIIFVTNPLFREFDPRNPAFNSRGEPIDEIRNEEQARTVIRNGVSYLAGVEFFYELRQHADGRRANAPNFYDVRTDVLKSISALAEASARFAGIRATSLLSMIDAQKKGQPTLPMSEEFRRYFASKLEWWITNRNQNIYRHFAQNVNESAQILSFYNKTLLPLMKNERDFATDKDAYDALIKRGVTWGMANTLKWNPGDTERIGQEASYNEKIGKGYKGEIRGWIGTSDRTYRPLFFMEKYPEKQIPNEGPQFYMQGRVMRNEKGEPITNEKGEYIPVPTRAFGRSVADKPVQVFTEQGQDAMKTGVFRPFFQKLQTPIADFGIAAIYPNQQKLEKIFAMQALQRKVFSDFATDYGLGVYNVISEQERKLHPNSLEAKLQSQLGALASRYGDAIFPINESSFMRDPRSGSSSYGIQQAIDTGYHSGQSIYEPRSYVLSQGFTIGEDFYRSALTIPLILGRRLSYFTRASTVFAFGYPSIYNQGMDQRRPYSEASFDRPRLGRAFTSLFANFRGSDMLGGVPLMVKKEGRWERTNLQDELRVAPRWRALIEQDDSRNGLKHQADSVNIFMRAVTGDNDFAAFKEFGKGENQYKPLGFVDRSIRAGQHVDLMIAGRDIATGPEKYRTPEFYDAYYQNVMKPYPVGMMNIDFPELPLAAGNTAAYNSGKYMRQHLNPRQASQVLSDHSYLEGMFPGIRDDATQNIWRRDLAPVDGYAIDPVKGTQIEGLIAERKREYEMYEFGIYPPFFVSKLYARIVTSMVGKKPKGEETLGTKKYLDAVSAAETSGLSGHERLSYAMNAYYGSFNPYTAWLVPPLKLSHTLERKGTALALWGASKARRKPSAP